MDADFSQPATALLTEHLQYTPLSLIDDVIDSVNNFIYQGIGSLESGLLATPPERLGFKPVTSIEAGNDEIEYPEAKQEIEEGLHKFETLMNAAVDKNFDKFEIYVLRNILCVPSNVSAWIRLGHYEGLTYPPPLNGPTPETIQLTRRKLGASRNISKALQEEKARNDAVLTQLHQLVNPEKSQASQPDLSFLSDTTNSYTFSGQQPLTTNTNFALSQLPALKALLGDLRTQLGPLKDAKMNTGTAKEERREERREYIEQRTKIHLERSGQNTAETSGPIHGKSVDPSEMEALEKIANTFNKSREGDPQEGNR